MILTFLFCLLIIFCRPIFIELYSWLKEFLNLFFDFFLVSIKSYNYNIFLIAISNFFEIFLHKFKFLYMIFWRWIRKQIIYNFHDYFLVIKMFFSVNAIICLVMLTLDLVIITILEVKIFLSKICIKNFFFFYINTCYLVFF